MIESKDDIRVHNRGPIRELQLDFPKANGLNTRRLTSLRNEMEAAISGGEVEALVLSGIPGMFSAGFDLHLLLNATPDDVRDIGSALYRLLRTMASSPVPIIAALTGHTAGAGSVLSTYCDARVMAKGRYSICFNQVSVGLVPQHYVIQALRRLVPPRPLERILVRAEKLRGQEALDIGLVDAIVEPSQVVPAADAWSLELLALPRGAMLATRRLLRADLIEAIECAESQAQEDFSEAWFSPETQRQIKTLTARLRSV